MSIYGDGPLMTYGEYYGDVYGAGGGVAGLVLGLKAELYTGQWTDITDYVYQRNPVQIQLGRQDESSEISPASCYAGVQSSGSAATIEAFGNHVEGFATGEQAGTFGSVPTLTSPATTYTQNLGPMLKTY